MVICARSVGRWLTPSVPFVESNFSSCPTEANMQDGPDSLTITMMLFLMARKDADAGLSGIKSKYCTYPSIYNKRENARVINKLNDNIE